MEKRLMLFLVSFFLSAGIAMAQTQVSGTVISSEDNEPIIGASIIVEGLKGSVLKPSCKLPPHAHNFISLYRKNGKQAS